MPMKLRDNKKTLAAVAVAAFVTHPGGARAEDVTVEIRELKQAVKQLEPLKERLKQLEAEVAKEKRERKEAQSRVQSVKGNAGEAREQSEPQGQFSTAAVPPDMPFYRISTPMPVFVSLERGLTVLSTDGDFSFHVGGRLMVDGGISSQPAPAFLGTKALPAVAASGYENQVGIRYARLQVLGSAYRIWDYKFQYDFAGAPNGLVIGGLRDAYLMLRFQTRSLSRWGTSSSPLASRGHSLRISETLSSVLCPATCWLPTGTSVWRQPWVA